MTSHEYARPELLASVEWLAAHIADPAIRVVDCRYYFNDHGGREAYGKGHIPGAVHVHWPADLADPEATPPNLIPRPEQLAPVMARLGISDDSLVVGYDQEGGHFASRLWWVLTYYGHPQAKILNGGIQAWEAAGHPLSTEPAPKRVAMFTARAPRVDMRVRAADVLGRLRSPAMKLLDVRRRTEYVGEEVRAARGGRIPGAKHVFWLDNTAADTTFLPADEIRQRYLDAGVHPEDPVVTYCQGGVRAAHSAFALALIGYEHVQMFDGSWAEWGRHPRLTDRDG